MSDRRILLDCTATAASGVNTGIQRVVRNIVRCAPAWAKGANASVVPVSFDGRHFQPLPPDAFRAGGRSVRAAVVARVRTAISQGRRVPILRDTVLADSTVGAARRMATDARWRLRAWRNRAAGGTGIAYGAHDWIVLLDSNWHADLRPELARARASGARVCAVVYDLIHVRNPEFVSSGAAQLYRRWFARTMPLVDRTVAISRAVQDEVRRYLDESGLASPTMALDWFHLGGELDFPEGHREPGRAVVEWLERSRAPLFVVVGTLEPRKGQEVVLEAFDALWRDAHDVRLLLIGREGWHARELAKQLHRHARWGDQLCWLQRASDADLDRAYRHAAAVITASRAEGYGLPLIEGLQRNIAVVASDLPVFREIAGDDVIYFPPDDSAALARCVRRVLDGDVPRASGRRWPTWQEAAAALLTPLAAQ